MTELWTRRCRCSARRAAEPGLPAGHSTPSATCCGTTRAATSTAGELTDIAGLEIGEEPRWWPRWRRPRAGHAPAQRPLLAVVIRDDHGAELDCTFFNPRAEVAGKPGSGGVPGKVGMFHREAAAHAPAVRAARRGRRDPLRCLRLPGQREARLQGSRSWSRQALDVLDELADPLPSSVRRGRAPRRARPRAAADPRARAPNDTTPPGTGWFWDESMGVQLALALGAGPRSHGRGGVPAPPGGLLDRVRRPAAVPAHRGQRAIGEEINADLAGGAR